MKAKSMVFALVLFVVLLSGCTASIGAGGYYGGSGYGYGSPGYGYGYGGPGYYARPYYGYGPRTNVIVVPNRGGAYRGSHGHYSDGRGNGNPRAGFNGGGGPRGGFGGGVPRGGFGGRGGRGR
ncbi:hypothetical protein [Hymenobacter nivis]|uniref:Neuropeptide-like protein 29 n=1 Tax=Hymenobacter nivis TaxID=1850093 RepID=A0A2Z3GKP3_9BACT|nr:hypothetical protein [Hymenobacter nivis]AWM31485.1 hypothetical protein DDQ68_00985 [Hymenobacter nivis]